MRPQRMTRQLLRYRPQIIRGNNTKKRLRRRFFDESFVNLADPTRLELATSAVTGQRSNQLSYESTKVYYTLLFEKIKGQNRVVFL